MAKKRDKFNCPIGESLEIFTGLWKPEILWHLQDGPMRFNQLLRSIGSVSQKMLTQQLRELQRDGIVSRKQYEEIPPRVEYTKTELGQSLSPLFDKIMTWHENNISSISKARIKYDRANS